MYSLGSSNFCACSAETWKVHCILPCPHLRWNAALRSLVASSFARPRRLLLLRASSSGVTKASGAAFRIPPYPAHQWSNANKLSESDVKVLQQAGKHYNLGDRLLRKGISGEDVRELQRYLQSTGHFNSPDGCTGYFGFQTQAAVQAWQSDHGVLATGVFGRQSRDVFTRLLAIEAQRMRPGRVILGWFSREKQFTASVSQQLHGRPALSRASIQGLAQCSFAFLLIVVTAFASVAFTNQIQRRHLQAQKLRTLEEPDREAEVARQSLLNRKRWKDVLDVDRGS